jgi:hypothetical protein
MRFGLLACFGLVACTGASGPTPPAPAVELGTGEESFEALADYDEIFIVQGPQGGYHFTASLLAWGVNAGNPDDLGDPSNPTITFRAFEGSTQVDIGVEYTQGLKDGGEEFRYQLLGRRVILAIESDTELDGREVRLEVELSDADGNVLTDERTLMAEPHPLNGTQY